MAYETGLVGEHASIVETRRLVARVARSPVRTVLIYGETGTGKGVVARMLHQQSPRSQRNFMDLNCAAIPENLLESELFGHERGAFTGADTRRIGRFEQAHGGTLFLDEIGDLALDTQAKLLRVLQERVITRVGGRDLIPVDVRVIAATHRDLPALVAAGKFREDLWYRMNVVVIALPPLRERREDVAALVAYFVSRYGPELGGVAAVQPAALRFLGAQPWPGNVRQLENVVKRALLLAHGYPITEELARAALMTGPSANGAADAAARTVAALCEEALALARRGPSPGAASIALMAVERELLVQAQATTAGNITQMAQLLGWSRLTVREKLKLHGLRSAADGNE